MDGILGLPLYDFLIHNLCFPCPNVNYLSFPLVRRAPYLH